MGHHLVKVLRVNSVQDVEEVLSGRALALWELVREVLRELSVVLELGVECLDAELIVVRDLYGTDLVLSQELLLVS